jgi:curli biogenesis system outer membrane secretion channel CsgG
MKSSRARREYIPVRIVMLAFLVLLLVSNPLAHGQRKKRIAILNFELGADSLQTAEKLGEKDDIGLTLSNILLNDLAGTGKIEVVERAELDKVLKEQNLSNSDRWDNTTAAKIGKIAGVDAILIGSVVQFVGENKETGLSKLGALAGKGKYGHQMQTKVDIATTARLVDVNTGVVLATAHGEGHAQNIEYQVPSGATGHQIGNPVLNEAVVKAIGTMAEQLDASPAVSDMVAVARAAYKGDVADVDANTLILNVGTASGVKVGDVVQIARQGRTIKDPKTGAILKVIYEPLGTATVTEADGKTATATYSGTKPVKVNDAASFAP